MATALHRGLLPSSSILLLLLIVLLVATSSASPVHEILKKYGFPPGLLPDAAKHYSLSSNGDFVVELGDQCYVELTEQVYFAKTIRGKLEFGRISDLSGIEVKKLFWLPVTGILAPPNKGQVEIKVGFFKEVFPVNMFEQIPSCSAKAGRSYRGAESLIPISEV